MKKSKSDIIFIVFGSFKETIPQIHNYSCINGILISYLDIERHQQSKFLKLQGICIDIQELFDVIQTSAKCESGPIDFSLFETQNNANKSLDNNEQVKREMSSSCRTNYQNDKRVLKIINGFGSKSFNGNTVNANLWYTRNCVIFRRINEAFGSGNIVTIYSYRYLIKLLYQQLRNLHETYRLYRSQQLTLSQILLISKHKNTLISLNNLISTTLDDDIPKQFCWHREINDQELLMFSIDVDLISKQYTAFVNIIQLSNISNEKEVLISIGAVFRIESVEYDKKAQFYRIHLSIFAKEVKSVNQSVLLSNLLFDTGEYQFTIDSYQDQALKHYKAASLIYKQANNQQGLGGCYHNIAS
ncbi:unnamed protein product [Adineta ricciae]|uniref:Uncharacterized protein n=1 Tax=Adineta ricciae TaxID=249248 RepID=A0A816EVH6_ADIRI|nr:unnamed protein product [Adineta ricciae]